MVTVYSKDSTFATIVEETNTNALGLLFGGEQRQIQSFTDNLKPVFTVKQLFCWLKELYIK